MSLRLVPPSTTQATRNKACALFAFRLTRSAQAKAAQIPGTLDKARTDIVSGRRESGKQLPNA